MTKSDGGDGGKIGYDKYVARNVGWFQKVGYSGKSAEAIVEIDAAMTRIRRGMLPGGILVLSEKICFADAELNSLNIALHHEFKKANGYSELEISQKRTALETVLIPETLATHHQRLQQAGFSRSDVWFQCFNFASIIALT